MYVCTLTAHLPCPSLPGELKPEESWAQYLRPNNVKFTCFTLKKFIYSEFKANNITQMLATKTSYYKCFVETQKIAVRETDEITECSCHYF